MGRMSKADEMMLKSEMRANEAARQMEVREELDERKLEIKYQEYLVSMERKGESSTAISKLEFRTEYETEQREIRKKENEEYQKKYLLDNWAREYGKHIDNISILRSKLENMTYKQVLSITSAEIEKVANGDDGIINSKFGKGLLFIFLGLFLVIPLIPGIIMCIKHLPKKVKKRNYEKIMELISVLEEGEK
jgi:hypothetical protein